MKRRRRCLPTCLLLRPLPKIKSKYKDAATAAMKNQQHNTTKQNTSASTPERSLEPTDYLSNRNIITRIIFWHGRTGYAIVSMFAMYEMMYCCCCCCSRPIQSFPLTRDKVSFLPTIANSTRRFY